MRIVFDCRYTRIGRHDGISRYTAGLVGALAELHPVTMLISDHRQLELLPELPWQLMPSPAGPLEPFVAWRVNRLEPDVVFTPMQTMGSFGRRYRLVLTVHDLIYYRHRTPPTDLPAALRLLWRLYHLAWWPQRILLNRADAVAAVSATTAGLLARHRLTRRPVTVIGNAAPPVREDLARAAADRRGPETNRLVYMGSFMPYKNVEALVTALTLLPEYELHLMSGIDHDRRAQLEAAAGPARLVFHDGASDDEYALELSRATALVSASLDEGFGIPLVEAMSLGTPVVVSDIPIFREIGGDAALYFDPHRPDQLAARVRSLADPERWREHSRSSTAQASRFSWDSSAARLLELLTTLGDEGPSADSARR